MCLNYMYVVDCCTSLNILLETKVYWNIITKFIIHRWCDQTDTSDTSPCWYTTAFSNIVRLIGIFFSIRKSAVFPYLPTHSKSLFNNISSHQKLSKCLSLRFNTKPVSSIFHPSMRIYWVKNPKYVLHLYRNLHVT